MEKDFHTDPAFIDGRAYQLSLVTIKIDKWFEEGKLSGKDAHFLIGELFAMLDMLRKDPKHDYDELFAGGLADMLLRKLRDEQ